MLAKVFEKQGLTFEPGPLRFQGRIARGRVMTLHSLLCRSAAYVANAWIIEGKRVRGVGRREAIAWWRAALK